jgi:riboflavin synthase
MFTGIIKEVGKVGSLRQGASLIEIGISSKIVYGEANVSDSIAINGVCLTLVKKEKELLLFEAIKSTLETSNLKRLKMGEFVNLEPSLSVGDKLGGHFVLGHVDCETKLSRIVHYKDWWQVELALPVVFRKYIVDNGSVAVEGISLTVKKVLPRTFTLHIIPFTYEHTNLKYKPIGSRLNIEFDYLLKTQMITDERRR